MLGQNMVCYLHFWLFRCLLCFILFFCSPLCAEQDTQSYLGNSCQDGIFPSGFGEKFGCSGTSSLKWQAHIPNSWVTLCDETLQEMYANKHLHALCMVLHTWCCTPGAAHLVLHTWCCTPGAAYLVLHTWCCTHGAAHLVLHTWCCTPGAAYLVLHTWCCTPGAAHLVLHTWCCNLVLHTWCCTHGAAHLVLHTWCSKPFLIEL